MKKNFLPILAFILCVLSVVISCGDNSSGNNHEPIIPDPEPIIPEKEYVTMSYNANGILGIDMPVQVQVEKGKPIPAAQLPSLSGGNIITFLGWSASATGGTVTNNPQMNFTVYASADLEFTEKLTLGNGQFALYRFDIPEDRSFDDYTKITVDYLVEDEDQITNKNVGMILHGVYNGLMLEQVKNNDQVVGIRFPITNDTDNKSIINNLYSSVKLIDRGFFASRWKTVEYALSGSRHGSFDNNKYLPKTDDLTEYIYFGLGITASTGTYTSYIKNIRLSNASGDKTTASTGSGFNVPAFAASDTQWGQNPRQVISKDADTSSGTTLPYLAEKHILGNYQFALYKFDIPAGSTLNDYTKISADFMIENPIINGELYDILEIVDGSMRLMGAYTQDMLIPVEVSGATVGYRVDMPTTAVGAPVDSTSILNNKVSSSRLVKVGFKSGEWIQFDFPFLGNRGGGTNSSTYDAGTYFPSDATGEIYFGIGATTINDRGTYTSYIRNIKMTNNDGTKTLSPSPVDYDTPAFYAAASTWGMNSRKEIYLEK